MFNVKDNVLHFATVYSSYSGVLIGIAGLVMKSNYLYSISLPLMGISLILICACLIEKDLHNV